MYWNFRLLPLQTPYLVLFILTHLFLDGRFLLAASSELSRVAEALLLGQTVALDGDAGSSVAVGGRVAVVLELAAVAKVGIVAAAARAARAPVAGAVLGEAGLKQHIACYQVVFLPP
jgi:hypothetical protein